MNTLWDTLQIQVDQKRAKFDTAKFQMLIEILEDKEILKKTSKTFVSLSQMLGLEQSTLAYLTKELAEMNTEDHGEELLAEMVREDRKLLEEQIEAQQERVKSLEKDIYEHPFSTIASIANEIMEGDSPEGVVLLDSLSNTRENPHDGSSTLTASELSTFAKSSIVVRRKTRKLANTNPDLDPKSLLEQADRAEEIEDGSWEDMMAIVKSLVAYGCLETSNGIPQDHDSWEKATYSITPAGTNVGMLGFENSLWALVAMGGAWDVVGASANLDRFHKAMGALDSDDERNERWFEDDADEEQQDISKDAIPMAQQKAETLLSLIRSMTPAQLAGYVAAIIAEGSRSSGGSVVELFTNLAPLQQRVIQSSLQSLERFAEVQKTYGVDPGTRACSLDISNVEVVTAWADGCSWNEALRLSGGLPPGDLARTLSRVLDAVRQLGNLPFTPIRKEDIQSNDGTGVRRLSRGIHPDVRRLCRDAAKAINRYPVKDPFSFEEGGDEDVDSEEEGNDDEGEGDDEENEEDTPGEAE